MKVTYDREVDAVFMRLSPKRPKGAIELQEGIILHVTEDEKIVGIEILNAKKRLPVANFSKSVKLAAA